MSFISTSRTDRFKNWWHHAFAVSPAEHVITVDDENLANKVATFVVRRKMAMPAIMLLETGRPLNYVGSQFLVFLSPFVSLIFRTSSEFDRFALFLEKRDSIPCIIKQIESLENQPHG